ncbi:FMN-binding protein [Aminipila butyrica]|uniref:FMN-binding protein n=1 Tax=Aminipila butyrica TaxID=433296 RepID=A0A858BYB5_9FIRM|nr:FMN-binding protein [Aminipila butyrica]QIB69066.1 FMN-binding protein [Aminipila butyrica]
MNSKRYFLHNKKWLQLILALVLLISLLAGCGAKEGTLQDGYFTAEMSDYSHGWKEFVTIYVKDQEIVSVEYNAKNASGFIKSWDMAYMRQMNAIQHTYPNRYTRQYGKQVLEKQSAEGVDAVSGASTSGVSFQQLVQAAIDMSKSAKNEVAIVPAKKE